MYREAQHWAHLLHTANSHAEECAGRNDAAEAAALASWRPKAEDSAAGHGAAFQILRIVRTGRIRKRESREHRSETLDTTASAVSTPPPTSAKTGSFFCAPIPSVEAPNLAPPPRRRRGRPRKNPAPDVTCPSGVTPGAGSHVTPTHHSSTITYTGLVR